MDPRECIQYLQLIKEYLHQEWLRTADPDIKAEIERIVAEIAELQTSSE